MSLIIIESIVGFSIREGNREIAMLNRMDGWDRERAETVLRIADDAWEAGHQKGIDEAGYTDGYDEGFEDGYAEAKEKFNVA